MDRWVRTARTEKGVALPLALFALVMLSGLLLAFLTMAGMEPEVAANLGDVTRARYIAEAGVESAYDQLATNMNWNGVLVGVDLAPNTSDDGLLFNNQMLPAPLNNATFGTYTARIRNDNQPGDNALTGQAACNGQGATDCAGATTDTNGFLILTVSGTYRGVTRQIQVVLRRLNLPPLPGAYSMPGTQADLWFQNANFAIDGRDYVYTCTANCSDPNPLNRTYTYSLKGDQSKMKYGIATQTGNQSNLSPAQTYESRAEFKLDTAAKRNNVWGRDQTNPGGPSTSGLNTVAAVDPATPEGLSAAKMQSFLNELAKFQSTQIYQSNLACAEDVAGTPVGIRMIGNSDDTKANLVRVKNQCGLDKTIDLGTKDKPALVYFRGDLDPTSSFAGVRTEGQKIKGAGILIVEDGDFRVTSDFEWDGIVIVTGRYVSSIFESGAKMNVYGASVANEVEPCEGGCPAGSTYWDGYFNAANTIGLRFSQQNLDLVQGRLLFKMSTWREL